MDLSNLPAGKPPPGHVPNFIDPTSRGPIATIVVTVTVILMVVSVVLRLYADIWISRRLEKAGWACLIAMAASTSYCSVLYFTLSQHLLGRHWYDVPISMISNSSVQNFTVLNITYGPAAFLAKLSVLMLYLRIFGVRNQTRILTYVAIAINLAQCLLMAIGYAILCVPAPGHSWALKDEKYACSATGGLLSVVAASISIFNDFFIITIPIPAVWSLQLATKKKIGVSAIFFTGLLVCVTSILNLIYRVKFYRSEHDESWEGTWFYMLCAVEMNVAIVCSCMPSLAAYISRHTQTFRNLGGLWWFPFHRRSGKSSKQSDSDKMIGAERIPSKEGDARYNPLTVGSALRDGRFLKTGDRTQFERSQCVDLEDDWQPHKDHEPGKKFAQTTRETIELRNFRDGPMNYREVSPPATMV